MAKYLELKEKDPMLKNWGMLFKGDVYTIKH